MLAAKHSFSEQMAAFIIPFRKAAARLLSRIDKFSRKLPGSGAARIEPSGPVSNKTTMYQIIPFCNYMKLNGNSEHNLSPGRRGYGNETLFDLPRVAPSNNTEVITVTCKKDAAGTSLALEGVEQNA
jgi:hypothetical protein